MTPRLTTELNGDSLHANTDYDPLVLLYRGFSPSGTFIAPFTYIISYDGTYYHASNSSQTVYGGPSDAGGATGTDVQDVVQTLLDDLDFSIGLGYKIKFIRGLYDFSSGLTIAKHAGSAWDTAIEFEGETGLYGTVLKKSFNGDLLTFGDGSNRIGYFKLKNLYIDGNESTGYALKIDTANSFNIDNLQIEDNADTAIYTNALWGGNQIWHNLSVQDCGDTDKPAVNLQGNSNGIVVYGGSVSLPRDIGIKISADSSSIFLNGLVTENIPAATKPLIYDLGIGTHISNSTINASAGTVPVIQLGGIRTSFSGNTVTAADRTGYGVTCESGFRGVLADNTFHDNDVAIYADTAVVTIKGNHFNDNNIGVKLLTSTVNLSGNTYFASRQQSLYCNTCSYGVINGESIINTGYGSGANSYSGIYLDNSYLMTIVNCVVHDYQGTKTTKYGVEENGAGANQNTIAHLMGDSTGLGGVYRVGNKTHILNSWVASDTFIDDNFVDRGVEANAVNGTEISYALPQKATNIRLSITEDVIITGTPNKPVSVGVYGHSWAAGAGVITLSMYDVTGAAVSGADAKDIDWIAEYRQ